jgi:GntR family transcriptional repressor for pyruvate dehydrogenase complex
MRVVSLSTTDAAGPIAGLRPVQVARAEPASTEVARALLEYILSGHIGPGEKLPSERQLSESLGVGRGVVREGVKSLGLLGLVEFRHGGGTYLRSVESDLLPRVIEWGLLLGEQRVSDLVEARQRLEEIIAELAAQRRTQEQLGRIESSLAAMRTATDTAAFVEADVEFHLAVAAASNNGALANMHSSIASLLHVWIDRVMHAADSFEPSYLEHVPIFEAIAAGDATSAVAAAHTHMELASARLIATLQGAPEHAR